MLLACLTALAVQAIFSAALLLPVTVVPVSMRFALGLVSVPLSALCGTLMFRRRHPQSSVRRRALVFYGLIVLIVAVGLLFSAATGNYDLP